MVVFPQPDGPSIVRKSPFFTFRFNPSKTLFFPKDLELELSKNDEHFILPRELLNILLEHGYKGEVYAINETFNYKCITFSNELIRKY